MHTQTPGPYQRLTTAEGEHIPWYMIPFDKKGRCKAPRTRQHLLEELSSDKYTHVYLFSHGWNNDWAAATRNYVDFINGYINMRSQHQLSLSEDYQPLLIGVCWPSTSLVLPWEEAPRFAGPEEIPQEVLDILVGDEQQSIGDLAAELDEASLDRFYELIESYPLDQDEGLELARLLAPLCVGSDEIDGGQEVLSPEELLETWLANAPLNDDDDEDIDKFGSVGGVSAAPQPAGLLNKLDPRHFLRLVTVWRMKDRAGTVGALGVGFLLREALNTCNASFHLIGHSYGGKVVLSSICYQSLPRKVTSALLLQPAVSHLCFAEDADGEGTNGGFRVAFERIKQPILSTFSCHDFPLNKVFHLAVRRRADLGEQRIAAGVPPNRYAALGGFGPSGCGDLAQTIAIRNVNEPYDELKSTKLRLLALNGSRDRLISGHGDISNSSTWWALYEQVRLA